MSSESVSSRSSEVGASPSNLNIPSRSPSLHRRECRQGRTISQHEMPLSLVQSSARLACRKQQVRHLPFVSVHLHPPTHLLLMVVDNSIQGCYVKRNYWIPDRHSGCPRTRGTAPSMDSGTRPCCLEGIRSYHVQPRAPACRRARAAKGGGRAGQMDQLLCVRVFRLLGVIVVVSLTVCVQL